MMFSLRQWLRQHPLVSAVANLLQSGRRLIARFEIPLPDASQLLRRITMMERHIVLPIKVAGIAMLLYFYSTPWIDKVSNALDTEVVTVRVFFWIYIGINLAVAVLLFNLRSLSLTAVQWLVFGISLIDGIFLSTLLLVTGGYNSLLYWLFLGLIVRCAVSVPRGSSQLALNFTLCACYVLAGYIDVLVAENLKPEERQILLLSEDYPPEPVLLRLVLLLLATMCCYGLQMLLEKQRQAQEEAREFAMREGQLRSAGRLAAEFAHQIKNPLAIINNAAFSLQRALKDGRAGAAEQIRIIQEEVERSDRIITQVMGYAQLSEGRVEKLSVIEELNRAIDRVFPAAAQYPVRIDKSFDDHFPPLLMQRNHVFDTFVNLLQNAREALGGRGGNIRISARCRPDLSTEVRIEDDGPGVSADKHERIFEAYYTTKDKGTGLGLATVKHNMELYGGSVRVQSELGKGARFILVFPARTVNRLETRI